MSKTLTATGLLLALVPMVAWPAIWYADASVPSSGDGTTWETAFKTIQEGIDASTDGDTVIVAPGTYPENVALRGGNIALSSTEPLDPEVVAKTVIRGVKFAGIEDETCLLSGFVIGAGISGYGPDEKTRATIQNNVITGNYTTFGAGVLGCDGAIRNNVISRNHAVYEGGGLAYCDGLIENNIISGNCVGRWACPSVWLAPTSEQHRTQIPTEVRPGGGLYSCNGTIRNNIIVRNTAWGDDGGMVYQIEGWGGGLAECEGIIEGNLILDNWGERGGGGGLYRCGGVIRNNTIARNWAGHGGGDALHSCHGEIRNCIIWANSGAWGPQLHNTSNPTFSCIQDWSYGGEGNISEEPKFADAEKGDFRLSPDSPCIDAGFNDPELPEFDIVGMHRIMFGGKSLTVDMGAYEFYINKLEPVPGTNEAIFTWSSLADKTYSIFYSPDILTWHLAIPTFPSSGNTTTFWIDDGSLTGLPPSLAPLRFYRLLENRLGP